MASLAAAGWSGLSVMRAGARVAATGVTAGVVASRAAALRRRGARVRDRGRALRDACQTVLRVHGLEVEASGVVPPGGVLLASNHVSWIDPLVICGTVACAPISKMDVQGWPVIGKLAGSLGVIFHARGEDGSGLRVMRESDVVLAAGLPVLNFPEGTTTTGFDVLRFRRGLFGLAKRRDIPVVPVAIRYQDRSMAWVGDASFVPHYLRLAASGRQRVRLQFGEPVLPGQHEDAAALADEVRARVVSLLEAA